MTALANIINFVAPEIGIQNDGVLFTVQRLHRHMVRIDAISSNQGPCLAAFLPFVLAITGEGPTPHRPRRRPQQNHRETEIPGHEDHAGEVMDRGSDGDGSGGRHCADQARGGERGHAHLTFGRKLGVALGTSPILTQCYLIREIYHLISANSFQMMRRSVFATS